MKAKPSPVTVITITPGEFTRLLEARQLQIERYRTAHFRQSGELPAETDPAVDREWLAVKLGAMAPRCIRVGLLTKWARTFDSAFALTFDLSSLGVLTLSRGSSRLRTFTLEVMKDVKGGYWHTGTSRPVQCEPPILLTVNAHNSITVEIPDIAAELISLKAEATQARKQVANERAIAKARKVEKQVADQLARETERANEAQAVIDSLTLKQAIKLARRCLAARRLYRTTVANPETLPAWLPATYQGEAYVEGVGDWQSDDYNPGHFVPVTLDTRPEWESLAAALLAARTAREAYKPRLKWPSWASAKERKERPELGSPIYGPQFDALAETETKARKALERFTRERFAEYCTAQGLPDSLASEWEWSVSDCRHYSRARILLRSWPAEKAELESKLAEARAAIPEPLAARAA